MKTISIVVPCYNEEDNVLQMGSALITELDKLRDKYNYEVIFIDNASTDKTRDYLRKMCSENSMIKAIFNAKNFGPMNSPYYGLLQARGHCAILFCCDFQDPIEMIPKMIKEWERGFKVVCCRKTSSKENPFMRKLRTVYYRLITKMSNVEQIEHFTGFGLYDREFIELMRTLKDPTPFLRGVVAEYGYKRKDLEYVQQKRRAGKTHLNFYSLYDTAMLSITSYTKVGLRLVTFFGAFCSVISLIIAFIYLLLKLLYWNRFAAGTTPILLSVLAFGSIELFVLGFLGEYVMSINNRAMDRPLVVEEERINFNENGEDENEQV